MIGKTNLQKGLAVEGGMDRLAGQLGFEKRQGLKKDWERACGWCLGGYVLRRWGMKGGSGERFFEKSGEKVLDGIGGGR